MPSIRFCLASCLAALTWLTVVQPTVARAQDKKGRKPNIIVIVADDLGYADLGCQGCKDVPTPHIDSIAKNGVRFTRGYVSCPVCSPTRAGIMTGRYQQRFGHEFNPGPAQKAPDNFGLPLSETTVADLLKRLGYFTGIIGKWHLGYLAPFHPQKRGFDEFYGFLGGAHSYVNATGDKFNPILRGTEPVDEKEYLTNAFRREALNFVDKHRKEPFFLYLTFNAVHAPMQTAKKYHDRFANIKDDKRRDFAAMLSAMDDAVGALLARLREHNLEDDTLIVFISDNGGPTAVTSSSNFPLRGFKGQLWEGGVRVPFLIQWKGRLPAGKVFDHPVIALDILPTVLAAANAPVEQSKLDGVNLLPYLKGDNAKAPHEMLFWRYGPQAAVRKADWKMVRLAKSGWQLFDLAKDIGEQNDLAAQKPEMVKELETAWKKWDAELAKPLWLEPKAKKDGAKVDVHTFSIVAYDPDRQEWGVGVASKYLAVGNTVPWAKAGTGAVATQASVNISHGPNGLELLAKGMSAEAALKALAETDKNFEVRQVAVIDAKGNVAVHTGKKCIAYAGHKTGKHYSCQGNLLAGEAVIDEMAKAFEETKGALAWRIMAALEAADRAGGDKRGKQAAAILVVRDKSGPNGYGDRYLDFRVDDHQEPVAELARILALRIKRPN